MKNATQVKDHIKNLAKDKKIDPLVLMKNYMMERFLERISRSPYQDYFILKGGLLVAAYVGVATRTTVDIDATIKGFPLKEEVIQRIIKEICQIDCEDHVIFALKKMDAIHEEGQYPGIRVSLEAKMDRMSIPVKLDITTGDVITPREMLYRYPLLFEKRSISILAYNLETLLAEKYETLVDRGEDNTRMRDFYDLFLLWQLYGQTINPDVLSAAIRRTAEARGTLKNLPDAAHLLDEIFKSETLRKHWNNYQNKHTYAKNINWEDLHRAVDAIGQISVNESARE